MSVMKESLRELATQNHFAARHIQALIRGHQCRLKLWSYNGILTVAAIVKIQKSYRGCLGRRRVRQVYLNYIIEKREIIRGLCRCWKARRVLRIKRAEFYNKKATMLQCAYRSRASRRYMAELKRKVFEKMAVRLQRNVRAFVARRWVRRLWIRVQHLLVALTQKIKEDIRIANSLTTRMTLDTMSFVPKPPVKQSVAGQDPKKSMSSRDKVALILSSLANGPRHPRHVVLESHPGQEEVSSMLQGSLFVLQQKDGVRPPQPRSLRLSVYYSVGETLAPDHMWGRREMATSDSSRETAVATEKWLDLHACLCHLVGTNRPDFAIDLLRMLLAKHPNFLPALFCLMATLFYSWSSAGVTAAKLIREDYLEEAIAISIRLQNLQLLQKTNILNSYLLTPGEPEISREADFVELMEKAYFWNGFRSNGCNSRTLSLLGCWVIARQFSGFGNGLQGHLIGKGGGIGRARRLLDHARDRASYRDGEGIHLRSIVLENIFENAHESILKQRLAFRDLLEDSESVQRAKKRTISVDLECLRCGEMLLVVGMLVSPRKSQDEPTSERASSGSLEKFRRANALKWTTESAFPIRPLSLLPPEVSHVYEVAVSYFMKALGQSEVEVRSRPRWRLLSEYVTQGVRLASCGSSRQVDIPAEQGATTSMLSIARLILPFVEYRRQERNAIRVEDNCAKLIQRAFRGFQGRALWKRLHLRILDEKRQKMVLGSNIDRANNIRAYRYYCSSLIQAHVKGWILRRQLREMHAAALVMQCLVRKRLARQKVLREIKRRAAGPEVIEMLRKGSNISGHTVTVIIYRCGGSYKVVGHDLVHGCQYIGFVYEPEMSKLLKEHNAQYEGECRAVQIANCVMPWQHLRAAEVLLCNLSLTTPITSLPRELGKGGPTGRKSELTFVVGQHLRGRGIESPVRRRILADQTEIIAEYDELMAIVSNAEVKRRRKNRPKAVF